MNQEIKTTRRSEPTLYRATLNGVPVTRSYTRPSDAIMALGAKGIPHGTIGLVEVRL